MRIAMIGSRGVPATFGGIERHVEEIGCRLVERGHEVTVYCRSDYLDTPIASYRGMELRVRRTVQTKHLEAIMHSAVATADALRGRFDVLHYHAVGPAVLATVPRAVSRARVVATVHGLDSRRGKWGGGASRALRGAEWLVPRAPHETVVVAKDLVQHFDQSYGRAVTHIPNGVNRPTVTAPSQPVDSPYVLFVGRLVPEKAPDLLIAAFAKVQTGHRLVIAGGSSHTDGFVADLEQLASGDDRVDLPGYVYGDDLATLYAGADAFVLPSLLEGLPLTLLEAASYGLPLIASDISPHREVLTLSRPGGRLSVTGDADSLTASIQQVLDDLPAEREGAAQLREQVLARYDWDRAVDELLVVYGERRPTVIELDNPVPAADRART